MTDEQRRNLDPNSEEYRIRYEDWACSKMASLADTAVKSQRVKNTNCGMDHVQLFGALARESRNVHLFPSPYGTFNSRDMRSRPRS